jgi:DNA-directed RNA polymerase specialized sigma24 family protein
MVANERRERAREFLSQAIVDAVKSWPELHRGIFIQVHYEGKSAEAISSSYGLQIADIIHILKLCERKLSASLRAFRTLSIKAGQKSAIATSAYASN